MRLCSKGGGGSAAGRMLLVAAMAVTVPVSAALFGGCGDDEREHAPLPDGGVGATPGSSSGSSSSASSGAEGGQGGAGGSSSTSAAGGTGGVSPLCANGVKDGTESDVDCGGAECPPCADGKICTGASDCVSLSCELGLCSPAACDDGVQNGDETDVDCGGSCGPTCVIGKGCTLGADCVTSSCVGAKCAPPTCVDGVKNGAETGKDCGGPNCPNCAAGEACANDDDCQSLVCDPSTLICLSPTCTDGVKNGTEPDTDCGGGCSTKCSIGKACALAADCVGGSAANCVASKCACPPGMVIIPIAGEGTYCIDQTEVSYNEYLSFYQANPAGPAFKPSPQCDGNLNYTPVAGWPPAPADLSRPVVSMDWCDAFAYCAYVGKRLCGRIGGGVSVFADFADHTESEWHNACSANGQNVYPYGDGYLINACQGDGDLTSVAVKTVPQNQVIESSTCIGGSSPFLFHLSGNVAEWEDSCQSTAAGADCHVRGGAFGGNSTTLACAADLAASRTSSSPDRGFRCCL